MAELNRLDTNHLNTINVFQKYAKKNKLKNIYITFRDEYLYFTAGKLTSKQYRYQTDKNTEILISFPVNIDISAYINQLPSIILSNDTVRLTTYGHEISWTNEYVDQDIPNKPENLDMNGVSIKDLELLYEFTDKKTSYPEMTNHVLISKSYMGSSDGGKMICIDHSSTIIKEDHEGILIPAWELKNILDIFKNLKTNSVLYGVENGKVSFLITGTWYTYDQVEGISYPNYLDLVEPQGSSFNKERLDTKEVDKALSKIKTEDDNSTLLFEDGILSNVYGIRQSIRIDDAEDIGKHYISKNYMKLMVKLAKSRDYSILNLSYLNVDTLDFSERCKFNGIRIPIFQECGNTHRAVYMPLNPDLFATAGVKN